MVSEITATDLKKRLDAGDQVVILDVREPHELAICSLANTAHIPLGQLPTRVSEIDSYKDKEIIVYCRSGKRSERAAQFLADSGFTNAVNLAGGILSWSDEVDPAMAKY